MLRNGKERKTKYETVYQNFLKQGSSLERTSMSAKLLVAFIFRLSKGVNFWVFQQAIWAPKHNFTWSNLNDMAYMSTIQPLTWNKYQFHKISISNSIEFITYVQLYPIYFHNFKTHATNLIFSKYKHESLNLSFIPR